MEIIENLLLSQNVGEPQNTRPGLYVLCQQNGSRVPTPSSVILQGSFHQNALIYQPAETFRIKLGCGDLGISHMMLGIYKSKKYKLSQDKAFKYCGESLG